MGRAGEYHHPFWGECGNEGVPSIEGLWSPQGKVTLYQQSHWVQAYRPMGRGGRQEQEVGPDKGFEMVWVAQMGAQMGK